MPDSSIPTPPTPEEAYRIPQELSATDVSTNRITTARLLAATGCLAITFHCWYHVHQSMWMVIVSICITIGILRRGVHGIWPAIFYGGVLFPAVLLIVCPLIVILFLFFKLML